MVDKPKTAVKYGAVKARNPQHSFQVFKQVKASLNDNKSFTKLPTPTNQETPQYASATYASFN